MNAKIRLVAVAGVIGLSQLLSACESEPQETSVAQRALDKLQKQYDELIDDKIDAPIEWASGDLENIGDWEYRVESLSYSSPEDLASQFNALGDEKWEVIWLERTPAGFLAVLKKPSISYLSKIPLSQLGRFVIGTPDGQE